ncbi:copper chaperone PCu(A)C [Bombella sp. ESL0387]|nr:copper chaperone PCu(A)C [Bombella sp. ESL0387]
MAGARIMNRTGRNSLTIAALLIGLGLESAVAATDSGVAPPPLSLKSITINDAALHTRYREAPFAFGTFSLSNHGVTDMLLRGITSPGCNSVTSNRNSQVAIQSPRQTYDIFQRMAVPHEGTLVFPTSGYHLICHGLKVPYQAGSKLDFTFHFQDVGDVTASFVMQPIVEEKHVGP